MHRNDITTAKTVSSKVEIEEYNNAVTKRQNIIAECPEKTYQHL